MHFGIQVYSTSSKNLSVKPQTTSKQNSDLPNLQYIMQLRNHNCHYYTVVYLWYSLGVGIYCLDGHEKCILDLWDIHSLNCLVELFKTGLYVCLFVYMCRLPWLDHSRLRSENSFNNWRFTQDVYIRNCISYYTMRHNYTTFHESTTIDISILNFIIEWLNNLRITFFYLFDESIYWCCWIFHFTENFTVKVDKPKTLGVDVP